MAQPLVSGAGPGGAGRGGSCRYVMYVGYRVTPFLYEMRAMLDWACAATTLDFWQARLGGGG